MHFTALQPFLSFLFFMAFKNCLYFVIIRKSCSLHFQFIVGRYNNLLYLCLSVLTVAYRYRLWLGYKIESSTSPGRSSIEPSRRLSCCLSCCLRRSSAIHSNKWSYGCVGCGEGAMCSCRYCGYFPLSLNFTRIISPCHLTQLYRSSSG